MKPRMVLLLILWLSAIGVSPLVARPLPKTQSTGPSSYSNTTDGLQKFVWDMVAAEKSGGEQALAPYLQSLALPDDAVWFSTAFGKGNGQQLRVFYDAWTGARKFEIAGDVARAVASQMTDVAALNFARPGDPGTTDKDNYFLGLLKQPQIFYVVNFKSENGLTMRWDGGFRYLGNLQIQAPPNNFLGSNIQPPKLIKEVQAIYPSGFNMPGNTGNVKLWGVIGVDGTVRDLHVIRGTCPYAKATIDAVKKWRFTPLTVDGKPQNVVYPFQYNFGLSQ